MHQECESFQSVSAIPTEFVAKNLPAIPVEAALCLYRVAQESLRNIQKHAGEASHVSVSLTGSHGGITLSVKDDGNGFMLDQALRKGGLGFISMEERLRTLHGKLAVRSKPGAGTTVTAFVPQVSVPRKNLPQGKDRA